LLKEGWGGFWFEFKPQNAIILLMNNEEKTQNSPISESEQKILKFWQDNKIFEKSVEKPAGDEPTGEFSFYDGPPFATGLPHYGHLLASIMKDAVPRYQTMKGNTVSRRWGWDCHGLPIENMIEKEFGLNSKKDIEEYGIDKFNKAAHDSVLTYDKDWKEIIPRIGRWVDMEASYKTMDWKYTESIWWIFKSLYDNGLIYKGHKPMHICPRCETTLANFEVNQPDAYQDIKDISVTVKFELEDEPNTFILAWTTTPWTLPGNVALAVNPEIDYVKVRTLDYFKRSETGGIEYQNCIIAKDIYDSLFERSDTDSLKLAFGLVYASVQKKGEDVVEGSTIIKTIKGSELIGKSYQPIFDYYKEEENACSHPLDQSDCERGWKIYGADFVNTEDGTGIVHIAPAFGEDDMNLGQKEKLPFIQHVGMDGQFISGFVPKEFEGMKVKPKDTDEDKIAHMRTDIEVIKWLQENGHFFSKTNITHSYPHCWRCKTPLLNYAASSWFVEVPKIKDELIANNQKVKWVPEHVKDGRFGKWLEGSRDWAISRTRYWGAPLPVWVCDTCKKVEVAGSIQDIQNKLPKSDNKYFVARHGQAEHNLNGGVVSSKYTNPHTLTELGEKQAVDLAEKIKEEKIDLIFSSDFIRTKKTAEIIAEGCGLDKDAIIFDERLREPNFGIFEGKNDKEYHEFFGSLDNYEEKFKKPVPEGENLLSAKSRISSFLYEIDKKYSGKNILIVSHEYPIWLLFSGAQGMDTKEASGYKRARGKDFINTGEFEKLEFTPIPHNNDYELDLHRPYIDDVEFNCQCGGMFKRVPDVFDCWFESGSMPYGQSHYPFEKDTKKDEAPFGFPADFIAEGMDQTRGWFYSLLVLATALHKVGKLPSGVVYKKVIVNGIALAEDGQKMSKSLRNYPDPMLFVEKYGADAVRYYLLSSPIVRGENLSVSEKGIDEVYKKVILRLKNVVSFYELYSSELPEGFAFGSKNPKEKPSENVLDRWILARLTELGNEITNAMDGYELDKATRPIADFVDDLSTWYIRRSRDRFKAGDEDSKNALFTTKFVLKELSKFIAPFMPFVAEEIYQKVKGEDDRESVHLEKWIKMEDSNDEQKRVLENMKKIRSLVEIILAARAKNGIKVRQPLGDLLVDDSFKGVGSDYLEIVKDETNIKKISLSSDTAGKEHLDWYYFSGDSFVLDGKFLNNKCISSGFLNLKLTRELIQEGISRDLIRTIQDLRKTENLTPDQKIELIIETDEDGKNIVNKFSDEIKKITGTIEIKFSKVDGGTEILNSMGIFLKLRISIK